MSDHNCLENIMDVIEASTKWGMSQAKVKQLCMYNQVHAKKIGSDAKGRGTWVILRNQPTPTKR